LLLYQDIPLWRLKGFNQLNNISISKAPDNGLTISPIAETITDTMKYLASRENPVLASGLTSSREKEILKNGLKKKIIFRNI